MNDHQEQILRAAAVRLREPGAPEAAARAAGLFADWLDWAATRLAGELPTWHHRNAIGASRRTVPELIERHYGHSLAAAAAALGGPLPAYTSTERRAIADRDAEIDRLREALYSLREGVRGAHPAESLLAVIARVLGEDAPRFINGKVRRKLRIAAETCEKTAYLTHPEARHAVQDVLERYGRQQRAYHCTDCRLYHLTSRLLDQGDEVTPDDPLRPAPPTPDVEAAV